MGRTKGQDSRRRALDLWQPPEGAGEALVCIATSFTFDATFFETECVGRFLQMETHPSETESVGYLVEREEKLAGAGVFALVDRRHARDKLTMRWDILGVLVPKAIQHSKVALLVWANHIRVIVGSGNLTEPGCRKNLEVFGTIELSKRDPGPKADVEETIGFLSQVLGYAVGQDGTATPKGRARGALAAVRKRLTDWEDFQRDKQAATPIFGLPGNSVFEGIGREWPGSGPPRSASVVSPFFDRPEHEGEAISGLISIMAKKRPREFFFSVRTEPLPEGGTRVFAPSGMVEYARIAGDVRVFSVLAVQEGETRDLHAKMLRLENDQWQMLLAGSSNFTAAGLAGGNLEANLLYRVKTSDPASRSLLAIWPDVEDLEIDSSLRWDPEPQEVEDGGEQIPLPAAFQDAIFTPGTGGLLTVTLAPGLPASWSIGIPDGADLLTSQETGAGSHEFGWVDRPVPFVLRVAWSHGEETAVANWPVNVSNPGALPPPEELKSLSLEELLEILSSIRTLPEAVIAVLNKRGRTVHREADLDPLRRNDSQAFLLRRTKRVGTALDRLRDRLERPALTRDAFEWRLYGAIGPMALADAFAREAKLPGEAKFYLAELALTLGRVKPERAAVGGLNVSTISGLLIAAISGLEARSAETVGGPESERLDEYAKLAFMEAKRQ